MTDFPSIVVVSAPQGSGKTRYAEALAKLFGCTSIVEEWDGQSALPAGALALTHVEPCDYRPGLVAIDVRAASVKGAA